MIALEDLSFANGLPALGHPGTQPSLGRGEAIHFLGTVWRKYEGKGGMILLMQWSTLEEPV